MLKILTFSVLKIEYSISIVSDDQRNEPGTVLNNHVFKIGWIRKKFKKKHLKDYSAGVMFYVEIDVSTCYFK